MFTRLGIKTLAVASNSILASEVNTRNSSLQFKDVLSANHLELVSLCLSLSKNRLIKTMTKVFNFGAKRLITAQ